MRVVLCVRGRPSPTDPASGAHLCPEELCCLACAFRLSASAPAAAIHPPPHREEAAADADAATWGLLRW